MVLVRTVGSVIEDYETHLKPRLVQVMSEENRASGIYYNVLPTGYRYVDFFFLFLYNITYKCADGATTKSRRNRICRTKSKMHPLTNFFPDNCFALLTFFSFLFNQRHEY